MLKMTSSTKRVFGLIIIIITEFCEFQKICVENVKMLSKLLICILNWKITKEKNLHQQQHASAKIEPYRKKI